MANMGKQYVSSRQGTNLGQRKSIFEPSKFPQPSSNITPSPETTDLSGYRQPQPGEMMANVMDSLSTSKSASPPSYITGKQLPAPKRQEREVNNASVNQLKAPPRQSNLSEKPVQKQEESIPNQTGLPDNLKTGIENLSGYSLDNVRVHYNSSKPAQLQALAYTQGTDIHVAPGQEKHLPHEAWHVVQQMQGRVKPTMQMRGVQINDDEGLEREAEGMVLEASKKRNLGTKSERTNKNPHTITPHSATIQCVKYVKSKWSQIIREEKDDYSSTFMEEFVTKEEYDKYKQAKGEVKSAESLVPMPKTHTSDAEIETKEEIQTPSYKPMVDYPLGFDSMEEFRDATRYIASKYRGDKIIVSGSSVTGKKFTSGKPFDDKSDIDIGIVGPSASSSGVDSRGFPIRGSTESDTELKFEDDFKKRTGRTTGTKFFVSSPRRIYITREHTPEGERKRVASPKIPRKKR